MTKKQNFIKLVEFLMESHSVDLGDAFKDGLEYFESLKENKTKTSNTFTENGAKIISFMKSNENKAFKASDIAEGLFTSPRAVSGSIRKLITDGFVTKDNSSGTLTYSLTESGKTVPSDAN